MTEEKIQINKKDLTVVEKEAETLLSLMGIKSDLDVSEDKENEAVRVEIKTEKEKGLLIGHRGETLLSIQTILGMIVKNKTDKWIRVLVDVGDWREKQEEQLKELAFQAASKAKETGEAQPLYNLKPSQRRLIHLFLSKEKGIETESQGEGDERFLVVKSKK